MTINITCVDKPSSVLHSYPKLMCHEQGSLVCFVSATAGFVLRSELGLSPYFNKELDIHSFKPFTGKIILENS